MSAKVDNSERWADAKVELRRSVLQRVRPARVLDCYAGRGHMWLAAWRGADGYLGIDQRPWRSDEPHRRLVLDNREACAALDLQRFNVFDIDAYGEPWTIALLLSRRRWLHGETGAVVLTDGSYLNTVLGNWPSSLTDLGVPTPDDFAICDVSAELHVSATAILLARWGVTPTWYERVSGNTGRGSQLMHYSAIVFEGN